jgi:hypothetical protein
MRNIRKIIKYGNHIDLKWALDYNYNKGYIPDMHDLIMCHDSRRIILLFRKNSFIIHSYVTMYIPQDIILKLLIYYGIDNDKWTKHRDYINYNMVMSYYPEY